MKRLATIVCGSALAVAALAGCGSDDGGGDSSDASDSGEDYCSQIESAQEDFSDIGADATVEDIDDMAGRMQEIADSAPEDIQPKWESGAEASSSMAKALEDAGVETDKPLSEIGQDPKAQKAVSSVLEDTQTLQKDQEAIQKQVKKECDLDMGGDSGSSEEQN